MIRTNVIVALLMILLSCNWDQGASSVRVREIMDPEHVSSDYLGAIEYIYADSQCILLPGLIESSEDLIYLALCGENSTAGVSSYTWEGDAVWSVDYGEYGFTAGLCIYNDSLYFSVIDDMPVLNPLTGDYLVSFSVDGISDSLMLPEAPGEFMPAIKATQSMDLNSDYLLWTLYEFCQRASYIGFISDRSFSFQRNIRVKRNDDVWYIGVTEGHFEELSSYEIPSYNYYQRPNVCRMALTDTSFCVILSYRDLLMEFDFEGNHIRSTHFGHQLQGPTGFTCLFPVSSSSRNLLCDLDTDNEGNFYLLYSGYGVDQEGKAEIWRVNTVSGEARMTQLNHSACAFTICGNRAAVVEQAYESGEGEEVILLGTPEIHLYDIHWDE